MNNETSKLPQWVTEYKSLWIGIGIGLAVFVLVLINMDLVLVSYYKAAGEPTGVVNILSKKVKEEKNHSKVYFKQGMAYLVDVDDPKAKSFLEKYFAEFDTIYQEKILTGYNGRKELFADNSPIVEAMVAGNKSEAFTAYIKRMEVADLERALTQYFGEVKEVSLEVLKQLTTVLENYPNRLKLEYFHINLYELMVLNSEEANKALVEKLLTKIDPESGKKELFKELKSESIEVEMLNQWVEVLNRCGILTTNEYANFTRVYGEIHQIKNRYKQLGEETVDLENKKAAVEVQIEESLRQVESKKQEVLTLQSEVSRIQSEITRMEQYESIQLYIQRPLGNGEYEAAIPTKSWFTGEYKPSSRKVVIALNTSQIESEGVYEFNVYAQGTKKVSAMGGGQYPYYVEISSGQIEQMKSLSAQLNTNKTKITQLNNEIAATQGDIDTIKKTNNYDESLNMLTEIANSRAELVSKLKEKQIEIQTLFGIKDVKASIE